MMSEAPVRGEQDEALIHELHLSTAIYFASEEPPTERRFKDAAVCLEARAEGAGASMDGNWRALARRFEGRDRWSDLVRPYEGPRNTGEELKLALAADQSIANILRHRAYRSHDIGSVQL